MESSTMNQPNLEQTAGCALPPPNEMILKWAEERPNEVYLKQIINRQFVEFTYAEVADKSLKLVTALRNLGVQPGEKSHWFRRTVPNGLSAI